jgi:thiosulfate dehydrogenase [quinone] large subunit
MGAKTFAWFYNLLASPSLLPFVDFLNKWGLTLIGLSLILGVFSKLSSLLGAILMLLYYFPILQFPYPNPHSFIVDEHIIYLLSLVLLYFLDADKHYGLYKFIFKK